MYDDEQKKWLYMDGTEYNGTRAGADSSFIGPKTLNDAANHAYLHTEKSLSTDQVKEDLRLRRKSVYTYVGKLRNNIYKTNSHVNR